MANDKSLNERAGIPGAWQNQLWHVDDGVTLFAGPLQRNALHHHSVPVYLAGLYDTFRLRIDGAEWLSCRAAVIPAGVSYEFDMGGDPLVVLYLEPSLAGVEALTALLRTHREVRGALIGQQGETHLLQGLYEQRAHLETMGDALRDVTSFAIRHSRDTLDPRVSLAVRYLCDHHRELAPVEAIASAVGLSSSRFQHLFTQQVGVPFRRYRSWHRIRFAIREIVRGNNFTSAAHAAGFADQAHFSREFRKTFGASPTASRSRI
jgi:AraC-like DNA-binding protein